jgi:hypothetical protein
MLVASSNGCQKHLSYGDLKKEVYMTLPFGFLSNSSSDICKLKRFLYELKQASRAWFDKFQATLL